MAHDISGFGIQVQVFASNTFPAGINLTQFADDADPFDLPAIQIADKSMGLNGDLITWSKASPVTVTINLISGSEDAINMDVLAEANRMAQGKASARDLITMTGIYPDGRAITLWGGAITNAMPGDSVSSAGRKKSKTYTFLFENRIAS